MKIYLQSSKKCTNFAAEKCNVELGILQVNLREIWYNYRSEVVFFLVLSAIVALSTYLSQFIPETVFDNTITPILITATVATALIGVLLMHRRNDGIKERKLHEAEAVV